MRARAHRRQSQSADESSKRDASRATVSSVDGLKAGMSRGSIRLASPRVAALSAHHSARIASRSASALAGCSAGALAG